MTERRAPRMPSSMELRYTELAQGRVRTRVLGRPSPGVPPVVVVQGMTVSDYLLPACARLASWTQVHLLDLPGYAGSGQPTSRLDVPAYGRTVADWLAISGLPPTVLAGHSSGSQVAAWAGLLARSQVSAVVLASPTIDPIARPLPRLLWRWRLDGRHPAPGLQDVHVPEWRRAGSRGIVHLIRTHLADRLEEQVGRLEVPTLLLRARQDRLSTDDWVRRLASSATEGQVVDVPGSHPFVWQHPDAWSEPLRRIARSVA